MLLDMEISQKICKIVPYSGIDGDDQQDSSSDDVASDSND
jgi:hypothetical protein